MRHLLPLALILALPACATMQNATPQITAAITRAADAWSLIKATAALWLPRLSPDRQAQVQHAIAIGDQAILTAQTAATVAEASVALSQVNVAADQVTAATR